MEWEGGDVAGEMIGKPGRICMCVCVFDGADSRKTIGSGWLDEQVNDR